MMVTTAAALTLTTYYLLLLLTALTTYLHARDRAAQLRAAANADRDSVEPAPI